MAFKTIHKPRKVKRKFVAACCVNKSKGKHNHPPGSNVAKTAIYHGNI